MFSSATHRQAILIVPVFLAGFGLGHFHLADRRATHPNAGEVAVSAAFGQQPRRDSPKLSPQPAHAGDRSLPEAGMPVSSQKRQPFKPDTASAEQRQPMRRLSGTHPPSHALGRHLALWGAPLLNADGDLVITLEAAGVKPAQPGQASNAVMGMIVTADSQ